MVNMTVVIGKKDFIRYVIKLSIIVLFLFLSLKIVNLCNTNHDFINLAYFINTEKLIGCIDENLHIAKQINNKKDELSEFSETSLLKYILKSQFTMINNVAKVENDSNEDEEIIFKEVEHAQTGQETEVLETNVPIKYTNTYNDVFVRNETGYGLTEEMLLPNIDISNRNIIIFHTHTCESYTPTENYNYEQTGTYRTTDLNYSVARVGSELEEQLNSYNFNVIHDTTYHDYPAYDGSYGRSLETVKNILNSDVNADIIIDLHRDAIGDYSYAPTVKIGEEYASQLMFVIGTDGGGLEHSNWGQNLKFAIKVQQKANELYPRTI